MCVAQHMLHLVITMGIDMVVDHDGHRRSEGAVPPNYGAVICTLSYTSMQLFQVFFSMSVLQTIVQHTKADGAKNLQGRDKPWNNISVGDLLGTFCIHGSREWVPR